MAQDRASHGEEPPGGNNPQDAKAQPDNTPPSIPDHDLLMQIGSGSYGTVWLARNTTVDAYRAVKVVYRSNFKDAVPYDRELSGIRKFEPVSRSHEGFLDVLHVGINDEQGYFYYVMELGDDEITEQEIDPATYVPKTLASHLGKVKNLDVQACLSLGTALSQALTALHKQGLVHRDIKPSNIVYVHGVPKLADIGLVARIDEGKSIVGTQGYIPPEGPGSAQADIYSLGKVLYEAITGKDRQEFPELPANFLDLPEAAAYLELNEIVLRACHFDPARRYRSAWAMNADILVLANGKSVRRLHALERQFALVKRSLGIAAAVSVILGVFLYQIYQQWQRKKEDRQLKVGAAIANGNNAIEKGAMLDALRFYYAASPFSEEGSQSAWDDKLRLGSILYYSPHITQVWYGERNIYRAEFSPDGGTVLAAYEFAEARSFDAWSGRQLPNHYYQRLGKYASFSKSGDYAVTVNSGNTVTVWSTKTHGHLAQLRDTIEVRLANFSPDGSLIVVPKEDGTARVWDWQNDRVVATLTGTIGSGMTHAEFSHSGSYIVTSSKDATARIWAKKSRGWTEVARLKHPNWVTYASFSPDDERIVTACADCNARIWEISRLTEGENPRQILPVLPHKDQLLSAEYSPDGQLLVTACVDGSAHLWNAETLLPYELTPALMHGNRITYAQFGPDSRRLIVTSSDGSVRVWDFASMIAESTPVDRTYCQDSSHWYARSNNTVRVFDEAKGKAMAIESPFLTPKSKVALSRNGRFLIVLDSTNTEGPEARTTVQAWNTATGRQVGKDITAASQFIDGSPSDDCRFLALCASNEIQIVIVATGQPVAPPSKPGFDIRSVDWSPGGAVLAVRATYAVQILSGTNQNVLMSVSATSASSYRTAFSPDGKTLATAYQTGSLEDCTNQFWNPLNGKPAGPELKQRDGVMGLAFSPDGSELLTAGENSMATSWDIGTARLRFALPHSGKVMSAEYSPNGQWIVTTCSDHSIRIWSNRTGDPLTPKIQFESFHRARFTSDGKAVILEGNDGSTSIWDLPLLDASPGDLAELVEFLKAGGTSEPEVPKYSSPQSMEETWNSVRRNFPKYFEASTNQIIAWHRYQAGMAQTTKHWSVAFFHLRALEALEPEDTNIANRIKEVRQNLNDLMPNGLHAPGNQ